MFTLNDDNSIYVTRGDIVFFSVSAEEDGVPYHFVPGDVLRIKVFAKKNCEDVVLQKDFAVLENAEFVDIYLDEKDTKIGEVISKPRDYWYEVELNPLTDPQTIIGYGEDGPCVFRLFPEGADVEESEPITPEDVPIVDEELDIASPRPIANMAVAEAIELLKRATKKDYVTPQMFGAVGDGVADDADALSSCFEYAQNNAKNVILSSCVYGTSKPLTVNLSNIIYGNNGVIKAIADMDAVIVVNKQEDVLNSEAYNGCSAIYDLNVDGNSLANKGIFVKHGKGITLKNVRVKAATYAQMQVCEAGQQVWELIVDNVELRCKYEGGYSPYGLFTKGNNTDSYYKNILIINSSVSWVDSASAASNFEDIHGYGYPAELAADVGLVFRGNGNFIKGISVDTPMNKGIVCDGDYNTFSDIAVGNMQSATGRGIEVNGTANTFDGIRCSSYYCFYITSGENTIGEFKCIRLFSRSEYDYFFTGKLPYRCVFDTKTEVTNNIRRNFVYNDQWFYQSVLSMSLNFEYEIPYNNYNVHIVGVKQSAPNYSIEKTTTGCTITCTDAITSGRQVNVIIDSPRITLI